MWEEETKMSKRPNTAWQHGKKFVSILVIDFPEMAMQPSSLDKEIISRNDVETFMVVNNEGMISNNNTILINENSEEDAALIPMKDIHCPWLLFLRPDEILTNVQLDRIISFLIRKSPEIVEIAVEKRLPEECLQHFRWVLTNDIFSFPSKEIATYHTLEPRIFHRSCLKNQFIKLSKYGGNDWRYYPRNLKKDVKKDTIDLAIESIRPSRKSEKEVKDIDIFHNGHIPYFPDLDCCDRFAWPPTIYLLMRHEHMPGILKALKKGLSSPTAVFFALKYLILNNDFDTAFRMLPLIPDYWLEKEPMLLQFMGMVYWTKNDTKNAIASYERAFALHRQTKNIEALVNAAKLCLMSGQKQKALELFSQCVHQTDDISVRSNIEHFMESIEKTSKENVRLSLCMIVRDEADCIEEAIKSMSGCGDEIIVVDTGSVDETKDIAAKCSARVYDIKWSDDFSSARNLALEKASGDYVFFLDADERLSTFHHLNFMFLKQILSIKNPVAYRFSIGCNDIQTNWMNIAETNANFIVETEQIRLFPNKQGIQFHGRVEESIHYSLQGAGIPVITIPAKDCQLIHLEEKREWRLMRKSKAFDLEDQRSWNVMHSAVKHFLTLGDESKAVEWLKPLYQKTCCDKDNWPYGLLLANLIEKRDVEAALDLYQNLLDRFPDVAKVFLASCSFFLRNNRFDLLRVVNCDGITSDQQELVPIESLLLKTYYALCMFENDCVKESIRQLENVLAANRHFVPAQVIRYYFLAHWAQPVDAVLSMRDLLELLEIEAKNSEWLTSEAFLSMAETVAGVLAEKGFLPERSVFLKGSLQLIQHMVNL